MTRKKRMKGNKSLGEISDLGKPPGPVTGPKASVEIFEESEESDGDSDDYSKDVEDFLVSIYGPRLKADLKMSTLSLREESEIEILEDYFRGREISFIAGKFMDEFSDFLESREGLDAKRQAIMDEHHGICILRIHRSIRFKYEGSY